MVKSYMGAIHCSFLLRFITKHHPLHISSPVNNHILHRTVPVIPNQQLQVGCKSTFYVRNCKGNLGNKTVLCLKLSNDEITKASLWGFMVKFQVHLLLNGAGSPWCSQVFSLAAGAKKAPGCRQVCPLLLWQVPPHPLAPCAP